MAIITLNGEKGIVMRTMGNLPMVGDEAPNFTLTHSKMQEMSILTSFPGRSLILYMFPSVDNPTCEKTLLKMNQLAENLTNTVVLCISNDLPFTQQRFSITHKLNHVTFLSAFRSSEFGRQDGYGTLIADGCFRSLLARAVVAVNPKGQVIYSELVSELNNEPNYEACAAEVRKTNALTITNSATKDTDTKDTDPGDTKRLAEYRMPEHRMSEHRKLEDFPNGISYFGEVSYPAPLVLSTSSQGTTAAPLMFSSDVERIGSSQLSLELTPKTSPELVKNEIQLQSQVSSVITAEQLESEKLKLCS